MGHTEYYIGELLPCENFTWQNVFSTWAPVPHRYCKCYTQNGSNCYTQVQRCIAILYTEAIVFHRRQNSELSKPWHRIKVPNYYLLSKKLLSINQKYIPQKFIICIMETYVQYITTILCLKIVVLYREHCCTCNVLLRKRSLNRWACL